MVIDRDHGYNRIIRSLYELDGLAAWVGVLDSKTKYKDGVSTAKVAAIWQAKGQWLSATIDARSSVFATEFQEAQYNILIRQMDPIDALADIAERVRKDILSGLKGIVSERSGLLFSSIRWRIGIASDRGRSGQQPKWSKIIRDGP